MPKVTTHAYEPIDEQKELRGNSRRGSDAPPEVQQKIIDIIIEEARKRQFNNRDIAYYIAIVKRESGFNPDAANEGSTASGVSQIQDETGKHLGLNDKNRFNARSNIQAGLDFFSELKEKIKKDYGSVAGKYEVLIYYCYHYGKYSNNVRVTINGDVVVKEPYPFSQIENSAKYNDSKTVVDEAARIEKILDDSHGLKIQLFDVLGKAMAGRKVVVVQKVAKETKSSDVVTTPTLPTSRPSPNANQGANSPETTVATQNTNAPKDSAGSPPHADAIGSAINPLSDAAAATPVQIEWELKAVEVTTDADGNLPEIETETQAAVMVLIPRIEYEAYNDAVAKQEIIEEGNRHHFKLSTGEEGALPTVKASPVSPNAAEPVSLVKTPSVNKTKQPTLPTNPFEAAAPRAAKEKIPEPSTSADISFDDIRHALQRHLGWSNVFETSFAYVKEFFTRPKLPAQPLNPDVATKKSPARMQTLGSSAKNAEVKSTKVKDSLVTSVEGTVKTMEVNEDAPWMTFALAEQTRTRVKVDENKRNSIKGLEKPGRPNENIEWTKEKNTRNTAKSEIIHATQELIKEKQKKESVRDKNKISELEQKIKELEKIRDDSDAKMLVIEKQYNDEDIVKYLQSTGLDGDAARDDATPWCSAFANWCVEQTKFHGKGSAKAEKWLDWGEEIKEPRYGAITVVTRGVGKYHVGFFLRIGKKSVPDGEEEIEVKGKDGKMTTRLKKKFRDVEVVHLLSGNQTDQIKEDNEWRVNSADSPIHLVSYRWPTNKELKK